VEEHAAAEIGVATEGQRGRGHGWGIALVLLGMLVAYPLSLGPAVKLVEKGFIPSDVFYFYEPLSILASRCPPASRFFGWYLRDVWRITLVVN